MALHVPPNDVWCVGLREHLGQGCGVLLQHSNALLPEDRMSAWHIGGALVATILCYAEEDGQKVMAQQLATDRSRLVGQLLLPLTLFDSKSQ